MPKSVHTLQTVTSWIISVSLALIPLFFLPLTQDYYDTNKWMLLAATATVVLVLWTVRAVATGSYTIGFTQAGLALAFLALTSMVSLLFASPNKVEAFLSPFGAGTWTSLAIVCVLGSTFFDKKSKSVLHFLILASASLLGLLAVYQFFGFGKILFPTIQFFADPMWTPVGSSIGLGIVLFLTLPICLESLVEALHQKEELNLAAYSIFFILIAAGLGTTLYGLVPKFTTTALPLPVGWSIMLESFKSVHQALFGTGSENFLWAFTQSRPLSLNTSPFWNVRFTLSSSFVFYMLTIFGAAGGVGVAFLLRSLWSKNLGLRVSLLLAFLSLFLLPPNFTALIVLTALLILDSSEEKNTDFQIPKHMAWLSGVVVLVVSAVFLTAVYALGRTYLAEMTFYQALVSLRANNGTKTYNLQIAANQLNPNISRFHTSFSQTNLALADAILAAATATQSGRTRGQNPTLSDANRQTATALIQQAIREAKTGVGLAPQSVVAWENLASIYGAISRVAQGADQWTVASYQQAIVLDPTNPILRLNLGGAYVGIQNFEAARQQYLAATNLKPDYANAHYNLAFVYRQERQYLAAAVELKATKALVQPGSDDDQRVTTELAEVTKLLTPPELNALNQQPSSNPSFPSNPSGILSPISEPQIQLSPRISLPTEASPSAR